VLGLSVVDAAGEPGMPEEERDEARINAWIERPAHAMSL
jgi:hypothetical protein